MSAEPPGLLPPSDERSCFGKTRYHTQRRAHAVAAMCHDERGHWLRVYECAVCKGFHLTHHDALPKPGWRAPAPSRAEMAKQRREGKRRRDRFDDDE